MEMSKQYIKAFKENSVRYYKYHNESNLKKYS